jgi:hypothetical protein
MALPARARRTGAFRPEPDQRLLGAGRRGRRLLQGTHVGALAAACRLPGGHQLLRDEAAAGDPRALRRLRPHQRRSHPGQPRRGQRAHRQLRLLRQHDPHHRARARHGERRPAARLPGHRDRGRALLGRWPGVEHASGMGGPQRAAPGHVGLPGRPVERPRRLPARPRRGRDAAEGDPVLQPDPRQYRQLQAPAAHALRSGILAREAAARTARQPGSAAACASRRPQGLLRGARSKHYEGQAKDYEFSRLSMREHWQAGYTDAVRTLRYPEVLERPADLEGVATFDLAQDGRE